MNEQLQLLLDRQDIYDCLVRFSRGIDRFDRGIFLSAFHTDAIISAGVFVGDPAALYEWAKALHEEGQVATQHNLSNFSCDIDGNTAHTETYYLFLGRNRDHSNWAAGGRYIDRLERRDRQWKIACRTNSIEWSGSIPSMDIPFANLADLNKNGTPGRNTDDPSYHRPLSNKREIHIPNSIKSFTY